MQVRVVKEAALSKADTPLQLSEPEALGAGDWLTPLNDMRGLQNMVKGSTILPQ